MAANPQVSAYSRLTEAVSHPLLPGITEKRLHLFNGGHYAEHNLSSSLDRDRVDDEAHVSINLWSAPGMTKPGFQEANQHVKSSENRKAFKKEDWLGPSWTNHWLHVSLKIPVHFQTSGEPVVFEFDPSCEGLIFTLEGEPIHAITGGRNSSKDGVPGDQEDRRVEHIIPRRDVQLGHYECIIEVSCNAMFGLGLNGFRHQKPDMNVHFQLKLADLVLVRSEAVALQIDFQILSQIAREPRKAESSVSQRALKACNDIMNTFRRRDDDEERIDDVVKECREIAKRVLGDVGAAEPTGDAYIWGIGHCHIDTAWLWTYSVAQQKIARSWSTQIDLMKRFPHHQFAASSGQHYAWLEELYPSLFESVSEYVTSDRFHHVGGSWVEHDCLLPSGESLCRQYLFGQRYFESKFGRRCREAWLPDTFGYASQLPQILRLAGMDYFFTQKLSWNNINTFPYSTFNWCGLDGSQVLSHMTPVDTYNASGNYEELLKGARKNKNLGVTDQCLLLFGCGDGGGGPNPLMLNKLQRLTSVATANPELPSFKIAKVENFFDNLCEKTNGGKTLPTWRGELYFELHRGTYTSQAGLKAGNRKMEKLLRDLEYFGALASVTDKSYRYPRAELDACWKDTLLGQFHDVLPGTSIKMAIDDQLETYARRIPEVEQLIEKALSILAPSSDEKQQLIVFDPIRLPRHHLVTVDSSMANDLPLPHQQLPSGQVLAMLSTDDHGVGRFVSTQSQSPKAVQSGEDYILENAHLRLTISQGRISSLVDILLGRELILAGPGASNAGLMLYDDLPLAYDAWDAEIYHLDMVEEIKFDKVEVVAQGPLRASLKARAKFGKSVAELTFSLDAVSEEGSRSWIRVDTFVEFHEKHKFLKFALPVDIHSPNATYGTQFGLIERPTHRNTTLDQAKFEVCGHLQADLSEAGYGISIVSDHKYGYAVEGNVMRLSLLRSATAPDPEQDQGEHHFSFAIMPHLSRLLESDVPRDALRFTNDVYNRLSAAPVTVIPTFDLVDEQGKGIVVETIKLGEDDDQCVVVRLYESLGGRARGVLRISGLNVSHLQWVNILEEPMPGEEHKVESYSADGSIDIQLNLRNFEIKTLKMSIVRR